MIQKVIAASKDEINNKLIVQLVEVYSMTPNEFLLPEYKETILQHVFSNYK
jgi:hypothetical protein